jgi:hypothetical protein
LGELAGLLTESPAAKASADESLRSFAATDHELPIVQQDLTETDDMNRREMLRLMSMAGTLIAASDVQGRLDFERLDYAAKNLNGLDPAMLDEYAAFPMVRGLLDVLVSALQQARGSAFHHRVAAVSGLGDPDLGG